VEPTGRELHFDKNDLIVSKTDLKGHLTYMNDIFLEIAGYVEADVMGKPHNVIRHPDMPRCVFKLLWDTVQQGSEIFAYVVNMAKNGDHYWVLAHVTPSYDGSGQIVGYHSTRRVADPRIVSDVITPLYKELCSIERSNGNRKDGLAASHEKLLSVLAEKNMEYDEFMADLVKAA